MTLEEKLGIFVDELKLKYSKQPYSPDTELKILQEIGVWVRRNTRYTQEGIDGKDDKWVASFKDVFKKCKKGYFYDDCDGYSMLMYFIAEVLGIARIRLGIVYQKSGSEWYTNGHMVLLYYGLGRVRWLPSTGIIGRYPLTAKEAFWQGWWCYRSFSRDRSYWHKMPKVQL